VQSANCKASTCATKLQTKEAVSRIKQSCQEAQSLTLSFVRSLALLISSKSPAQRVWPGVATGKIAAMADNFELGCQNLVCHLIVKKQQQGMASYVQDSH